MNYRIKRCSYAIFNGISTDALKYTVTGDLTCQHFDLCTHTWKKIFKSSSKFYTLKTQLYILKSDKITTF